MSCVSASIAWRRMKSYAFALLLARRRAPIIVSTTPPFARRVERRVAGGRERGHGDSREPEDALRVLAEELRPHVVAERHVGHLGEDALVGEAGREVAGEHDLVGAAGVRELDDVLGVVLRRERRGRVVEVRPLQEQLDREFGPRLTAVPRHELQLREEPAHLVDVRDVLRFVSQSRARARPRSSRTRCRARCTSCTRDRTSCR